MTRTYLLHLVAGIALAPLAGPLGVLCAAPVFPICLAAFLTLPLWRVMEIAGWIGAILLLPIVSTLCRKKGLGTRAKAKWTAFGGVSIIIVGAGIWLFVGFSHPRTYPPSCTTGRWSCIYLPALFTSYILFALCFGAGVSGTLCAHMHDRILAYLGRSDTRT